MRLSLALFLLSTDVSAFLPQGRASSRSFVIKTRPTAVVFSSQEESDDYDDWYADFDPSEYESLDNYSKNQGNGYGGNNDRSADHDYTRDTSIDNSNVDLNTVNYLIGERLQLRKTGRFDQADAIRDELMEQHGVMVRDKERVWRSGCSASGSGQRWSPGGNRKRGGNNKWNNNRNNRQTDFGPNGHDYNMARGAGPITSSLSEEEIHGLLAERLACKLDRDFRNADMIQEELLEAGVVINDKRKEWRADGGSFDEYTSRKYNKSPHSASTGDIEEIQALIVERAKAKSERLYNKADAIRDDLFDRFDVTIDDKRLEWSVGGDFGVVKKQRMEFLPFSQAPDSLPVEDSDEIHRLVEDRDTARADRDFVTADQIRDDLMARNIYIDDRNRQWRVGGRDGNFGERRENGELYQRRGGGSISEEEEELIADLLKTRFEHKRNRKFKSADKIRDRLRDEFQVQIDDRNREWHVITTEYAQSPGSATVSDEDKAKIEKLVSERAVAKLQRDYATADSIRDVLMQRYSVSLDDRVKEWHKLDLSEQDTESLQDAEFVSVGEFENNDGDDDFDSALSDEISVLDGDVTVEESPVESADDDLDALTVPELKERLRAAGLPVSGRKAELIERLSI